MFIQANVPTLLSPGKMPSVQENRKNSYEFISLVTKGSWIALSFASVFQCIMFSTLANTIAVGAVIVGWGLFSYIYLNPIMLRDYPLSTFLILGFTTTQLYFPLLFTSLEGKPITYNLELPYQVFSHTIISLVVLILSHTVYRFINQYLPQTPSKLLVKLGLFDTPIDLQLWLMGLIGLGATFYVFLYSPSIGWEVKGSASDKAIQALIPFSYAPFFLPFGKLYGNDKPPTKNLLISLGIFTLMLFLISIGRNSRGGFMVGFSSVGFAYGLGLLLGIYKAKFFTTKNFFILLGTYWLFTGPVADIGTAMVIVRGQRHDISSSELISNTLTVFLDKEAIRQSRLYDIKENESGEWNESYVSNIFLARFCNIKFNDLSLMQAEKIRDNDPDMREFSINYVWSAFPQPVLDALELNQVDKLLLRGVSVGDYLYYVAGGPPEALGGFRTGHFAGTGMAAFGWWYLLILAIGIIPIYFLFDKFAAKFPAKRIANNASPTLEIKFSLCGLIVLTGIFMFTVAETVVITAVFLVRDWIQLILLYVVIFQFTKLISLPFRRATN